jgi:hypothetical protein
VGVSGHAKSKRTGRRSITPLLPESEGDHRRLLEDIVGANRIPEEDA